MVPEVVDAVAPAGGAVAGAVWARLFSVACYVAAAGCLFHGIREGARTGWRQACGQLALFAFFALAFWAVESWAHHRTPYYVYSPLFWDLVPRLPFEALHVPPGPVDVCTERVVSIQRRLDLDRIPLGVVLMAASLTYSALWTARRLGANLVVQPLLAGLVMVDIDLFLDPVLATTHDCVTGAQLPRAGVGLGLWAWYLDPRIAAAWFDVPVFNYAAWFAAPVLLISITNLVGPFARDWVLPRTWKRFHASGRAPAGWEGALLALMVVATAVVWQVTPGRLAPPAQWALLAGLVALAAIAVVLRVRHFDFDHGVDGTLTRPTALALTIPSVALCFEGFFLEVPGLIPLALFTVGLGLLLTWLPCQTAILRACERLAALDRFVRLHYFGFTAMLVLLGAAAVEPEPGAGLIAGLLVVAIGYHVYGYVLNDVIDLDLDREQDRRRQDPLVRGAVSRESALATACVPVPVIVLVGFLLGVAWPGWLALGGALLLAVAYNLWGKRAPVPPLTDALQGLAWASLGLWAAWAAAGDAGLAGSSDRLLPLLVYGAGFIFLINGIHGGLRDLWNDLRFGKRTSALFLGARPSVEPPPVVGASPAAESAAGVIAFAFLVHTAMFVPMFRFLVVHAPPAASYTPLAHATASLLVGGLFLISNALLWRVVRRIEPHREWWVSTHLFVLLLPPLALYLPARFVAPVFAVLVGTCFFVPLLFQVGALERLMAFLRARRGLASPRACAPPPARERRAAPPPPPAPPPAGGGD